ncbi:MAG: type II toxin-antitoxin system RelE/ParE family toxin [Candidatus Koribacter versatilis]|uniref:Type II toxin-antitoxin system RelE/ParE family toxin n=1 Tax=Candidatus Korobacter versatilis TaxID=658062 RepID=A0A932A872_9BACT|nr:type II toxin-antitoxin system RelE/ParE family toxin [Candidatus Koribacter versatilis]
MAWTVRVEPRALRELERLDRSAQVRILRFLKERVEGSSDPRSSGKPVRGELGELWRYRLGDYRIVCRLEDKILVVFVLRVAHRRDIYR